MLEVKILISYLIICITYSLCRLHYLLTQKTDEEFNSMLEEIINLSSDKKNILKWIIVLQILFAPITAPFSMIKQTFLFFKRIFIKE